MTKSKVTEEDIRLTEALIGQSYGRLKTSVVKAPHDLVRPATNLIREHPFATAAAAAGIGLAAYKVVQTVTPKVVVKEVPAKGGEAGGSKGKPDITSAIISLAMPYVMNYLQQELGKMMAGRETPR